MHGETEINIERRNRVCANIKRCLNCWNLGIFQSWELNKNKSTKKCTVLENNIKYLKVSSRITKNIYKYLQVSQNVCNKYRQPRQKFSDQLTVPQVSRDALRHAGPCQLTLRAGLHEEHVEVPVWI